mgnify:CR=1 FL=1
MVQKCKDFYAAKEHSTWDPIIKDASSPANKKGNQKFLNWSIWKQTYVINMLWEGSDKTPMTDHKKVNDYADAHLDDLLKIYNSTPNKYPGSTA